MASGNSRKELGEHGEHRASEYIRELGFSLVAENFRSRFGEIDLIVSCGEQLVFVEVKTRKTAFGMDPGFLVNRAKQQRIKKTALYFIAIHPEYQNYNFRFDVINIIDWKIEHLENAFQ
ncbi:MAG: YraN family protein [Candidatus Wallbacteria bacterium]|nr:YraN family protein [Candidatus Wallbacteria bacterium]